ncbi:MAG: hypothetical protein RR320_04390, partial [Oscillospiraceae bacterium]
QMLGHFMLDHVGLMLDVVHILHTLANGIRGKLHKGFIEEIRGAAGKLRVETKIRKVIKLFFVHLHF